MPPAFVARQPAFLRGRTRPRGRAARARRFLTRLVLAGGAGAIVLWIAIQKVSWLGPLLADTARSILGPAAVAWLEDTTYGVQDRLNRWRLKDAPPTTYWQPEPVSLAPAIAPLDAALPPDDAGTDSGPPTTFPPPDFPPPIPAVAAKGDGVWIVVPDDVEPSGPPVLAKTLVHPDPARTYAAVAIVAMDLSRVRVTSVAGTAEPASDVKTSRPGRIPQEDHARLVTAFNGGWQAVHGHFGMMVDGTVLLPAKDDSCTFSLFKDGSVAIGTWTGLAEGASRMQSWRQTPPCLYEGGRQNPKLTDGTANWGAAVDGATIIRRSGVGLSRDRKTLFYGSGDGLGALTLARALVAAGAWDAAELDVNWAFPRYLFYVHSNGVPSAKQSLIPCSFKPGEYATTSFYRDFFYVTRR